MGLIPTRNSTNYGPIVYTGIRISGFHPEELGSIPSGATNTKEYYFVGQVFSLVKKSGLLNRRESYVGSIPTWPTN